MVEFHGIFQTSTVRNFYKPWKVMALVYRSSCCEQWKWMRSTSCCVWSFNQQPSTDSVKHTELVSICNLQHVTQRPVESD